MQNNNKLTEPIYRGQVWITVVIILYINNLLDKLNWNYGTYSILCISVVKYRMLQKGLHWEFVFYWVFITGEVILKSFSNNLQKY